MRRIWNGPGAELCQRERAESYAYQPSGLRGNLFEETACHSLVRGRRMDQRGLRPCRLCIWEMHRGVGHSVAAEFYTSI